MKKFIIGLGLLIATVAVGASIPYSPEEQARFEALEAGTSIAAGSINATHIATGGVATAEILDGTIVNADVSASAALAVSKLSLAEGSVIIGNSSTAGVALSGATDKALLIGNGTTMTAAVVSGDITLSNAGVAAIAAGVVTEADLQVPTPTSAGMLFVKRTALAVFDPSANADQRTADTAYPLGLALPDNAVIVGAWIDVITTFQSAGADAATLAVHVQNANDIVTATAISAGGDIWDAGLQKTAVDRNTANTLIKTSDATKKITVTTGASQALTAGKMIIWVEYVISE